MDMVENVDIEQQIECPEPTQPAHGKLSDELVAMDLSTLNSINFGLEKYDNGLVKSRQYYLDGMRYHKIQKAAQYLTIQQTILGDIMKLSANMFESINGKDIAHSGELYEDCIDYVGYRFL